jgi:hypothetical protein
LNEHDVEKITAFQYRVRGLLTVLPDRHQIHDASPFGFIDTAERHKPPTIRDARAQGAKYDLRPPTSRVSFDMGRYLVQSHFRDSALIESRYGLTTKFV